MSRRFISASSQSLNYASALTATMPITMAAWFRPASHSAQVMVSISDSAAANRRFQLGQTAGQFVTANHHDNTTLGQAVGTVVCQDNVWSHGVAGFVSTTSRWSYTNGWSLVTGATNIAGSMASLNSTDIGYRNNSTPQQYFDGQLAHVAIWNVELTPGEVRALAQGWLPIYVRPTALLAYYPLAGEGPSSIFEYNRAWNGQRYDMTVNGPKLSSFEPIIRNRDHRRRMIAAQAAAPPATGPTGMLTLLGCGA